nr:ribonuclease H-like domain-containing protein [Tanacetum cinerariifolium]
MLDDPKLPTMFWTEAVRTVCYVLNRVLVTSPHNKTPYALLTGNIPLVSHFKPFRGHVTILNISDHLGKFDGKADEGYVVGYSASNKAYRVYNVPNKRVEETMNIRFLKEKPNVQANHSAGTQEATPNPVDTFWDAVDDSPLNSADEIFQKELARLKGQEQSVTFNAESLGLRFANDAKELQKRASANTVPPGRIPFPTGSISVPSGDTMVSTDDVPVHTGSPTDSFFNDEPTTRFLSPSDLRNHDPSPSIFSSLSYDDELGVALNNVESTTVVSPVETKRINTIHPKSLIVGDPTSAMQTRSKVKQTTTGKYAIGTKWILKNKRDARGIVVRNKARLVAQGHRQEEGIDYDEVFALIARIEAIRLFLAFSSYMGFMVYQMDVKSAFLYRRIDEEVYVTQPKGFVDPQHSKKVYNVVKALYGLHQEPRTCQDKYVQKILNKFDLRSVKTETTSYEAPKPKSKNESDISACLRNQVAPTTSNLEAMKKIFKYLKGQPKLGLWYPRESPLMLKAYSDSDYTGVNKDKKSTTSGCQFLGRRLISW